MAHKNKHKYEWQSLTVGNIVDSPKEVVKQMWESLVKYHTLDIKWKCTKKELCLPTKIWAASTYINKEWDRFSLQGKYDAINVFLSSKYGFKHDGFEYDEEDGVITITNIKWNKSKK